MEGKGWVDAEDLQLGDGIRKADGTTGEVESIVIEQTSQEMYNLTVDQAHTFFVGDDQWLVHNITCPTLLQDADNIGELGAGQYPENLFYLANEYPTKKFTGIDFRFDPEVKFYLPSNARTIPGNYLMMPPLGFDAAMALAPGHSSTLDENALLALYMHTVPDGKLFVGSTENTFILKSEVEKILRKHNISLSWYDNGVGGYEYLGFNPQTSHNFKSFIYGFKEELDG